MQPRGGSRQQNTCPNPVTVWWEGWVGAEGDIGTSNRRKYKKYVPTYMNIYIQRLSDSNSTIVCVVCMYDNVELHVCTYL